MSKRNSCPSSNTLFNYFTKTPPSNKRIKPNGDADNSNNLKSNSKEKNKTESKKRDRQLTPSPSLLSTVNGDEEEIPVAIKKRKRIKVNPIESDDSDVENKGNKIETREKVSLEKKLQDSFKYEPVSPNSNKVERSVSDNSWALASFLMGERKFGALCTTLLHCGLVDYTYLRNLSSQIKVEPQDAPSVGDDDNWVHCKLDWLKPDKIRDANKHKPDHPDYDPSTLFVPPEFYKTQTPAHKQWWEMKSSHFDCVLFFKVGKFYELYHMDAAVGVNELGFSYMKGDFAHSGFPESAYSRMASTLVSKGYKVARVEQTETPDMMQERCKKNNSNSKADKVVRREICQVTLRGARAATLQDAAPSHAAAEYMLALAEEDNNGRSTYGVCFIDTTIGQFHMGQFADDKHSSSLLTTLAHYPPALVIYDRKSTTPRTSKLLSIHCHAGRRQPAAMWPPDKTLKTLAEKYYKTNVDGGEDNWPQGLKPFLHEGDALGLTPATDCYLAVKALGGCVSTLTDCLLDIQILGMAQFERYSPPDLSSGASLIQHKAEDVWKGGSKMVLDAITLRNLRIVQDEGCLYDKLNYCSTPMGKRLLYEWVCSPVCSLSGIKERQEAVKTLYDNQELCQDAKQILTTLPDLERLLAKIHALGNLNKSKHHPDSRAIFYEEKVYSKRKVLDFISVLNGYSAARALTELFRDVRPQMLRRLTRGGPAGGFPDYTDTLTFFKEAFDQKQAEKEGRILPGAGVDREYDDSLLIIKEIEDELKEYLAEQEKYFKCRLNYVGTDKKRYQIEVPQGAASKAGSEYHLEGTRKGFKKFSTAETKDLLARMIAAEEQKSRVLKDLSRRIFEKFSASHGEWQAAARCVAALDVLLALAEFARQLSGHVCLPEVTCEAHQKPYINIVEGRHPCIPIQDDFIPNDTQLGADDARLLLLTGPNMGGKSTLMRQVGLLTVLAHLGSYLPARECSLSLVDRVFTRLGAADDVLAGQSTFLVEMSETAAIVRHASPHSLVLLDELGRGTSTYDGTAIASGVCAELAARGCRTLFSTHYHALVHHLASHPRVALGHMACMVETDETTPDDDENVPEETITFLYELSPGACPKSYGFNAARLAGIPREITARAHRVSRDLEEEASRLRACRDILRIDDAGEIRNFLSTLSI